MSAVSVFQTAVTLARQGVHQDKAKNYPEAARCYREAISAFMSVRHKSANAAVARAIDEKTEQYRERLRKIDKYLLSKADLSKIFKSAVDFHNHGDDDVDNHQRSRNEVQRGLQIIERAKRKDAAKNYGEALCLYEEGMSVLLDVAMLEEDSSPENAEKIRFKCLLIHDRASAIRNFMESGVPIQDRKDAFLLVDSMQGAKVVDSGSRSGFDSCSASPEPLTDCDYVKDSESIMDENEEHIMLMEEVRSNLSFNMQQQRTPFQSETNIPDLKELKTIGSRHSLYPTCEIKRSPSVMSDASDFLGSGGSGVNESSPIPLANIDQELSLSSVSLKSGKSQVSFHQQQQFVPGRLRGVHSADMSCNSSTNSLAKHKYRSLHSSAENVISAFAITATSSGNSSYVFENDRNVSELTYANQMYDPKVGKEFELPVKSPPSSCSHESGSDSGISDPSSSLKQHQESGTATPLPNDTNTPKLDRHQFETSTVSSHQHHHHSRLSLQEPRIAKHDVIPRLCRPRSSTPNSSRCEPDFPRAQSQELLIPPAAQPKANTLDKTPSKKVKQSDSIDKLTVLSSEVVDGGVSFDPKAEASPRPVPKLRHDESYGPPIKQENVPPRSTAKQEEELNDGCYYFLSCLDAFGIL